MKLLSWNVNGIRAIAGKGFSEWFKSEAPDILCLQETKAYPEQLDSTLKDIKGYSSFWNNPQRKGYAGVAVYSKVEPEKVEKDFPPKSFGTEGRSLILHYEDFVLANVYFPNGGMNDERLKYKLDFYDRFLKYVKSLKKNVIVCGDFNTAHEEIDLARPKANEMFSGFLPEERAWMDKLVQSGFVDTFRIFNSEGDNYSWWDYKTASRERNVGWRIDYFFVSKKMISNVKDAYIMSKVMGSDHCPVGIEVEF